MKDQHLYKDYFLRYAVDSNVHDIFQGKQYQYYHEHQFP